MIPVTEFRMLPVSSAEPSDRTSEGIVLASGTALDLGTIDTTDEARDTGVCVVWWRASDMNGNSEISNIRVWLEGTDVCTGTVSWYMDITDTWTAGKTPVQVATGSPGTAPLSEPSANLASISGGIITGVTHDQTTQYIYFAANGGVNEPVGEKSGITLKVRYDYH